MYSYVLHTFGSLSNEELYALLRLRSAIFVVEQNCVFLDMDNKDQESHHLLVLDDKNQLVASCRILPPGLGYEGFSSIGRVVNDASVRGKGVGRSMMVKAIEVCYEKYPDFRIQIGGQLYLKAFYESLGFEQIGEGYLEDDIPHIHMIHHT